MVPALVQLLQFLLFQTTVILNCYQYIMSHVKLAEIVFDLLFLFVREYHHVILQFLVLVRILKLKDLFQMLYHQVKVQIFLEKLGIAFFLVLI